MDNPVPNASFEAIQQDAPIGWRPQTWGGRARYALSEVARTGARSVHIEAEIGVDGGWQAQVPVKPYSNYRLTAWIKTEGVVAEGNRGALINLHARPEHTAPLKGTNDWTQVAMEINTGGDDLLLVNCLLGYFGQARGKAWFDDLSLELLSSRMLEPKVTIDVTNTREPISPYIYGQFIEHLGRCIYGGIWAEMLEDRKFFFPVGSKESPWKVDGSVELAYDTPTQSPEFRVLQLAGKGSLEQSGLGLVAGREYVFSAWIAGEADGVMVTLGLSDRDSTLVLHATPLTSELTKVSRRIESSVTTNDGKLSISAIPTPGRAPSLRIAAVSLMPADNVRGMRRDTLALLKELNAPIYRWPGGNFVSGYDWKDGIGDRDKRPTRKNPAWQGIDSNDFGLHEFMDFCKELGTEPLVVVNTGLGSVQSAAELVQYVNGSSSSPMGKLRSRNGRREPWKVRWWGVGNEMYGDWQLGHVPLAEYVRRHNAFAAAMRAVDPTIKLVAVGENYGPWTRGMFEHCASSMDLISEHFYCQERPGVMGHSAQIAEQIRRKVANHRRLQGEFPSARGIKIAMDEWNYWYGPHVFGELGTRYFWKDGLGIARGLHEFFRSTDAVHMANYAQTVNVIGAIKTTSTAAELETTGLVLMLYRKQFGTIPVGVSGASEPLDVAAALTADRRELTLAIVNPTAERQRISVGLKGAAPAGLAKGWRIAHADPMAFNDPGKQRVVWIKDLPQAPVSPELEIEPYCVRLMRVPLKR